MSFNCFELRVKKSFHLQGPYQTDPIAKISDHLPVVEKQVKDKPAGSCCQIFLLRINYPECNNR